MVTLLRMDTKIIPTKQRRSKKAWTGPLRNAQDKNRFLNSASYKPSENKHKIKSRQVQSKTQLAEMPKEILNYTVDKVD